MENKNQFIIKPVAYLNSDLKNKFGIPRQSGRAPSLIGKIVFTKEFSDLAYIRGIKEFTHLWLIFGFSKVEKKKLSPTVRPPRLGGNKRVGVFATRSPFRPNKLGLSSVKLLGVEETKQGTCLIVSGIDLLDGTPIYDIKPYLPSADCHADAVGGFADKFVDYKLKVEYINDCDGLIPSDKLSALTECIADDPRPSYQNDDREYGVSYAGYNVKFTVSNGTAIVFSVEKE